MTFEARPQTLRLALLCALVVLPLGCAGSRRNAGPGGDPVMMGLYSARLEQQGEKTRKFRMLLFAELPDRIHAEILSPVGSTEMILDGGSGRLAVSLVRERQAFVGRSSAAALGRILGLQLELEQLVGGLLRGDTAGEGFEIFRQGDDRPGLPESLQFRSATSLLQLDLKRMRPLRIATATLGSGTPPPGLEVLPLDKLATVEPDDGPLFGEDGP